VRHMCAWNDVPDVKESFARPIIHLEFVSFRSMETENFRAFGSKTERSFSQPMINRSHLERRSVVCTHLSAQF
jgi:hypothetical protein